MALSLPTGKSTVKRLNPGTELWEITQTDLDSSLQGSSDGIQVNPRWAMPGSDEIGNNYYATYSLFISGYRPQPGDLIEYTPNSATSLQDGLYKQVADAPIHGDELGLGYSKLPLCQLTVIPRGV
jgi:hypothetical protein